MIKKWFLHSDKTRKFFVFYRRKELMMTIEQFDLLWVTLGEKFCLEMVSVQVFVLLSEPQWRPNVYLKILPSVECRRI
jgi:hypothetical protein